MASETGDEPVEWLRVEDVRRLEPRSSGDRRAPAQAPEGSARVRVARDDERRAPIAREPRVEVAEVEPIDLRIDLERDAELRRAIDDGLDVEGIGLTCENPP